MAAYSVAFLCTLCIFAALQVPGTSALFFGDIPWAKLVLLFDKHPHHSSSSSSSSSAETEIVNKHNELRRSVQPPASNMLKMSWDSKTAASAKKWADLCKMKHSSTTCGENLYMSKTKDSWDDAIQSWYNESKIYHFGRSSPGTGHYTQVVWYRSNKVGCAMAVCPHQKYKYYYVCQYCPAGNKIGKNPYKIGKPCGDCPNACDDKLCTNACRFVDKYDNCPSLVAKHGCGMAFVSKNCPASCKCKNEIK